MKVKLTQPGFENYTGQMGVIFFDGGVSTSDVSSMDATRLGAVMSCEWLDQEGLTISPAQAILDAQENSAPVMKDHLGEDADPVVESADKPQTAPVEEALPPADPAPAKFTQADLEAIADKEGIAGIRAIAEPLDIKGRSIAELIQDLIKAGVATPTPAE